MMRTLLMICLLTFAAGAGRAAEEMRCALAPDGALGLAESAAFNLLGVELSKTPGLALLERAEVAKVMKERSLGLALAAGGVGERRALGALLKARLLVILRAGERTVNGKAVRFVELAACESRHGLRLAQEELLWDDKNPMEFAKRAAAVTLLAWRRLAEPTRAILAVPPFVSDDLEHRYDAMQDAYARMLIESFAAVPGVRVVELEEARAIGDELRLTGDGGGVDRPMLPVYLNGHYRNEKRDAARTVKLALELRQGEQAQGKRESGELNPEAAAAWLQASAGELLGKSLAGKPLQFDAGVEAGELERKAHQFEALGEWEKALTLTEAALLLKPEDAELHGTAVGLCTQIINAVPEEPELGGYEHYLEQVQHAVATNLRGLELYDFYLRHGDFSQLRDKPRQRRALEEQLQAFWQAGQAYLKNCNRLEPEVIEQISELGRNKRDLLLAWQAQPAALPIALDFTGNKSRDPLNTFVPIKESTKEKDRVYLEQVRRKGTAGGEQHGDFVGLLRELNFNAQRDGSYDEFLEKVAALPEPQFRWGVKCVRALEEVEGETQRQRLDRLEKLMLEINGTELGGKAREELIGALRPTCEQLAFSLEVKEKNAREKAEAEARRKAGQPTPPPLHLPAKRPVAADDDFVMTPLPEIRITPEGWIKCAGTTDLIWDKGRIWRMRRRGQLELIHTMASGAGELSDITYDGRRAWAPLKDALLAIDPETGKVDTIDGKRGLPQGELKVAPLGEGRLCAVGSFGRTWCALLDYQGEGKPVKVDIFHEARLSKGAWDDPALAFSPTFAAAFTGEDGKPRVLVGRGVAGRASYRALLLDPARRTARTVAGRIANRLRGPMITHGEDGALYWITNSWDLADWPSDPNLTYSYDALTGPRLRLARLGGPECRETSHFGPFPLTPVYGMTRNTDQYVPLAVFAGGECFALLDECWLVDTARDRAIRLKGTMPQSRTGKRRLGASHHYGTVVVAPEYGSELVCYAFQPQAGLAARLAGLKLQTAHNPFGAAAAEHEVIERDPLDGRLAVVRRYQGGGTGAAEQYTTFTTPIVSRALIVEQEQSDLASSLVLAGADQCDPNLSALMKNGVIYVGRPQAWMSGRPVGSGEDPYYYPLGINMQAPGNSTPWTITVNDATGAPIAGATVEFTYQFTDQMWLRSLQSSRAYGPMGAVAGAPTMGMNLYNAASLRVRTGQATTDAAGRTQAPRVAGMDLNQLELTISHPEYGRAVCPVRINHMMVGPIGSSGAGAAKESDFTVRAPLVRRGGAEAKQAFYGRVVDAQGRPVEGARIVTLPARTISPALMMQLVAGAGAALSGADGRFQSEPTGFDFRIGRKNPYAGNRPSLAIVSKNGVVAQETFVTLTPGEEKTIQIEGKPRPCRVKFVDLAGKQLDPAELKVKLVQVSPLKFTGFGGEDRVVFDGSAGQAWPAELKLSAGLYQATGRQINGAEPVLLTDDGAGELTFRVRTGASAATPQPGRMMMAPGTAAPMRAGNGPSGTPAARALGAPTPAAPATGSKRNSLTTAYEGRVVDALTSRPLAGALVLTGVGAAIIVNRVRSLAPEALQAMQGPGGMLAVATDPALAPLRATKYEGLAARTDAAGRFKLEVKPWKEYYKIMVVAAGYIGISHGLDMAIHEGTRAVLPAIRMQPAAELKLQVKLTPALGEGTRIYLDYAFADAPQRSWEAVYPRGYGKLEMEYPYYIAPEEATTVRVPAGVKFKLTLRVQPATYPETPYWPKLPVEKVLELRQGETLELGAFEIRRQDNPIPEPQAMRRPRMMIP